MKRLIFPIFTALTLTGCVSGTVSKLSESHPGHPQAAESAEAIAIPTLMAGSQRLVLPVSTNQNPIQQGQHQHAPAAKGAQKPAEHKREHEHQKEEKK